MPLLRLTLRTRRAYHWKSWVADLAPLGPVANANRHARRNRRSVVCIPGRGEINRDPDQMPEALRVGRSSRSARSPSARCGVAGGAYSAP